MLKREIGNHGNVRSPSEPTGNFLRPNNQFRVFDQVDVENLRVRVLAFGTKIRSRLLIGGEEYLG